jgi:hypothetical protein
VHRSPFDRLGYTGSANPLPGLQMVVRRRRRAAPGRCVHRSAPGRPARHPGGGAPHPPAGPGGGLRGLGLGAWSGRLAMGAAPCMADPLPREHDDGPPAATLNLPAGCGVKPTRGTASLPGPGRARQVRASHPPGHPSRDTRGCSGRQMLRPATTSGRSASCGPVRPQRGPYRRRGWPPVGRRRDPARRRRAGAGRA